MKVVEHLVGIETQDMSRELTQKLGDLRAVLHDLPVPIYPCKSKAQGQLDILQRILNQAIEHWLCDVLGWTSQAKVSALVGGLDHGTIDFVAQLPDTRLVVVEVQLGNGGRGSRDYEKIREVHRAGKLALGVVVVFTHATAKRVDRGLGTFEALVKSSGRQADMPVCLLGLDAQATPVYDFSCVPWLPSAQILGGHGGPGSFEVQAQLARQMLEGVEPAQLSLCAAHRQVVAQLEQRYFRALSRGLVLDVERAVRSADASTLRALGQILAQQGERIAQALQLSPVPLRASGAGPSNAELYASPRLCA